MQLAAVEWERVVEGTVGTLLLAVALIWAGLIAARRWRARRTATTEEPRVPALARFADTETRDAAAFGGGAAAARVIRRRDTVVYGYLAVAEEYADPDGGASWCTLTVTLPGRVPFLVADHWQAIGRPGVPLPAPLRPRIEPDGFDTAYVIGVQEAAVAERVLGPAARRVLVDRPVQRLALRGSTLMVRSFDGTHLDEQVEVLGAVVSRFLAATPSFVQSAMATSGRPPQGDPLPEGLYGPDAG